MKLAGDQDVRGGAIDVEVHNGVVTLKGKVDTEKRKERAEKLTKKVKGVTGVENQIVITK
jgi:osmotically-inducible protein OsmY